MAFYDEASRSRFLLLQGAAGELEETVAGPASKMMVMFFPGSFIQGAQPRLVDLFQPPLLHQQFQVAIDRCLIQGRYDPAPRLQDFINSQRAVVPLKNLLDRISLVGLPLVGLPSLFRGHIHEHNRRWTLLQIDLQSPLTGGADSPIMQMQLQ